MNMMGTSGLHHSGGRRKDGERVEVRAWERRDMGDGEMSEEGVLEGWGRSRGKKDIT